MTIGTLINLLQAALKADNIDINSVVKIEFSDMNLQTIFGEILGVKMYNSGNVVLDVMEDDSEEDNDD